MTEPDDWAPLPPEQLVLHPGEEPCRMGGKRTAPVLQPVSPEPASFGTKASAPDPTAEAMLLRLKQRIAAGKPGTSLIADVMHREQKSERRRSASQAPFAADATLRRAEPQETVEYVVGREGRDPREEEPWFRELPPEERERLQATWAAKREQGVGAAVWQRRNGNRRFVAAIVVFVAVCVFGTRSLWIPTLGAGVCCGIWWRHTGADRYLDPLKALACLITAHAIAVAVHGGGMPTTFMDALILIGLASLVGFEGEIRRTGGFDVH